MTVYYFDEDKSKFLITQSALQDFVNEYDDYTDYYEPLEFLQNKGTVKMVDLHSLEYNGFIEL